MILKLYERICSINMRIDIDLLRYCSNDIANPRVI